MRKKNELMDFVEKHEWLSLAGILVVFTGIVATNIARWSVWFDEAFSAYIVRFDFAQIVHYTANDVHPPLYYWLLKCWTLIFGNSVVAMRSMSVFFALIGLVGLYFVLKFVTKSRRLGLLATLVASLSPVLVRQAFEIRMYTLVFAIVIWATYFLLRAQEENRRRWWGAYSLLVMLGMLTHYFTALAWVAHWAWRLYEKKVGRVKKYFSKEWVATFAAAIGLYAWWIPVAATQFATVQGGFWIPAVTVQTPINYFTETLSYKENSEAEGWWALLLLATLVLLVICLWKSLSKMNKTFRRGGLSMLIALAVVPPALLVVGSMPPLKSSFVNRYVLFAQIILLALATLALAVQFRGRRRLAICASILLAVCLTTGIYHVYNIGNYNKNSKFLSQTNQIIDKINQADDSNAPILTATQWLYYEAAAYESPERPIYYNAENLTFEYGSELMLAENDIGKVKSLKDFAKNHRYVWYMKTSKEDLQPPVSNWKLLKLVDVYNHVDGATIYKAGLYDTQG